MPIFTLLYPSILSLGSGTTQTDGQTDNGHRRLMSHHAGASTCKSWNYGFSQFCIFTTQMSQNGMKLASLWQICLMRSKNFVFCSWLFISTDTWQCVLHLLKYSVCTVYFSAWNMNIMFILTQVLTLFYYVVSVSCFSMLQRHDCLTFSQFVVLTLMYCLLNIFFKYDWQLCSFLYLWQWLCEFSVVWAFIFIRCQPYLTFKNGLIPILCPESGQPRIFSSFLTCPRISHTNTDGKRWN